jgi:hypothetical protein
LADVRLIIRIEVSELGDANHHSRIAREKRAAALEEFQKERFTVIGDLVLKVVEQAVEATAAYLAGKHFHVNPRTAMPNELGGQSRIFQGLVRH